MRRRALERKADAMNARMLLGKTLKQALMRK